MWANASGCKEEQRGVDALRSLSDWVGIVIPLLFGKGSGNTKRAGTVTYCSPKFSGATREVPWRPACWAFRQQNKCLLLMFPCSRLD